MPVVCFGLGLVSLGCGEKGDTRAFAKVTGKVEYHGQPLKSGRISFLPVDGNQGAPAAGDIQADGTYTMSTTEPGDGVIPGEYKVGVTDRVNEEADDANPNKVIKSPAGIAPMYESPYTSKIQVKVEPGSNDIPITLN